MHEVTLYLVTLVISLLYDMKVKHYLLRQINKLHLVQSKFFSLMQEITLYFLQQDRLHFMLSAFWPEGII